MKIGVDISQIAFKGSGVSRYTEYLIDALLTSNAHSYVFFFSSLRQKLDTNVAQRILSHGHILRSYPIPPSALNVLWNKLHLLPIEYFTGNLDIFVSSDWTQPPRKSTKMVTIIHDMIAFKHPETLTSQTSVSYRNAQIRQNIVNTQVERLRWVEKECSVIISDSHATKEDIENYLNIPSERIKVVYPYVDIDKAEVSDFSNVRQKFELHGQFALAVGKIEPRKNLTSIIRAIEATGIKDLTLVIAGSTGWGSVDLDDSTMKNVKVKQLGFVSENDLKSLYQEAEFYINASLYEGFGYPVIEAMTLGCPVIVSNTSSLAEVAGDACLKFDPHNLESISKQIKLIHNNSKLAKELTAKGESHAQQFSLQNYYASIFSIFESVE